MLKKISICFLLICSFCVATTYGQSSNFGNWLIYLGNKQLNEKWNLHHEVQYRNYDAIGDLEQLLLRAGFGYNLTDKSNILMGYGFIASENYIDDSDIKVKVSEHRIFQQFTAKQTVKKMSLTHRYRFEQRFIEDDFRVRFRYFLSLAHPLFKINESDNNVYFSSYNEIFLNGDSAIFDRNRLFLGLGVGLNKNLKLELGYMNQFFERSSRDQLNIITKLNF
jgi:hypothetical protein